MWAAQFYRFDKPRRWINSGGLGTMGVGCPTPWASSWPSRMRGVLHHRRRLDPDVHPGAVDLQAVQHAGEDRLLNNRYLGMVRQWQQLDYGGRYSHSYMDALPDFVKLAEAYGHVGLKVEKPPTSKPRCARPSAYKDRTVFLDVRTDPTENVWPMVQAGKGITEMLLGSEDL
jgi:acetolactate synthase-1/2/3 large subunit